jgi:hypothetical protein
MVWMGLTFLTIIRKNPDGDRSHWKALVQFPNWTLATRGEKLAPGVKRLHSSCTFVQPIASHSYGFQPAPSP